MSSQLQYGFVLILWVALLATVSANPFSRRSLLQSSPGVPVVSPIKLTPLPINTAKLNGRIKHVHTTKTNPRATSLAGVNVTAIANTRLSAAAALPQFGIQYHNGPVLLSANPVKVYTIYYGNWKALNPCAPAVIDYMLRNIGTSAWWQISKSYKITSAIPSMGVAYIKSYYDSAYSQGKTLNDAAAWNAVVNAILKGFLPVDFGNAVYFVLTSQDVNLEGFCSDFCGYHSNDQGIKWAFIGDPTRCPSACSTITEVVTPNNNFAGDAMASIIAHELTEAVTDPLGTAWWRTSDGQENADICSWDYGTTYTSSNGAIANVKVGSRDYKLQQNWANIGPDGHCALKL